MNIIVCLEDKNGMMFNKRRLSQDVAIREDIYKNMDIFSYRYILTQSSLQNV